MKKVKRMKRRNWTIAKIMQVITERERHAVTVKTVCQKNKISFTQYYRWRRRYLGKTVDKNKGGRDEN